MPAADSGQSAGGIALPHRPGDAPAPAAGGPFAAPAPAAVTAGLVATAGESPGPGDGSALQDALGGLLAVVLVACVLLGIRLRAALADAAALRRERDLAREDAARLAARAERVEAATDREVERRTGHLAGENEALRRQRDALEDRAGRLEAQAERDEATGLLMRPGFEAVLDRELRRALRENAPVTVVAWRVDHAARMSRRLGHERTAESIGRVAQALRAACRRGGDTLARLGPDRFAAILAGTPPAGAIRLADRSRDAVHALALAGPGGPGDAPLSVSAGVVEPDPAIGPAPAEVLAAIDAALAEAARRGGNRVVRVRMPSTLLRRAAG